MCCITSKLFVGHVVSDESNPWAGQLHFAEYIQLSEKTSKSFCQDFEILGEGWLLKSSKETIFCVPDGRFRFCRCAAD